MKKKAKSLILIALLLILIIGAGCLFYMKLYEYLIIDISILSIVFIIFLLHIFKKTDIESIYNSNLKKMLKRYDTILVETSTIPDLDGKNIMIITNIEDLIDASVEIRKPIYYKKERSYCNFILIDNQDVSIYLLKEFNRDTPIEKFIKDRKQNMEDLIDKAKDLRTR
ncbi:MAG: hypothetical protein IKG58_03040 [Bacilli bacterium]|nr:hypothetical protein [Bacilli bacterium]